MTKTPDLLGQIRADLAKRERELRAELRATQAYRKALTPTRAPRKPRTPAKPKAK